MEADSDPVEEQTTHESIEEQIVTKNFEEQRTSAKISESSLSGSSGSSLKDEEASSPSKPAVHVRKCLSLKSDYSILQLRETDPYSEDEAERVLLRTKPACFMILGKPGVGKSTLAKYFSLEWRCICLNAFELITQSVQNHTVLDKKYIDALYQGGVVPEEMVFKLLEEKMKSPEISHHGYILDDIPCMSESTKTIEEQLAMVKNFKLPPDILIHLKMGDEDLIQRKSSLKVDPISGNVFPKDQYAPKKMPKVDKEDEDDEGYEFEEEEEVEEEIVEEQDFIELPKEVVERLVNRPEDMSPQAEKELAHFNTEIQPFIDEFIADHDPVHVINLDGNRPYGILLKQLLAALKFFPVYPTCLVQQLREPSDEDEEEGAEEGNYSMLVQNTQNTDDVMRGLAPILMVAPRYRWRRSRWLRFCPVALFDGKKVFGKVEYAVSFLDKMYCLSNSEAMLQFMRNPRPYLLPSQPRPPCKVSVLGPELSGKTTLCNLLGHRYGAEILNVEELTEPRRLDEREKHLKNMREEVTARAIEQVIADMKEEADRLEAERTAALAAAEAEATALAAAASERFKIEEKDTQALETVAENPYEEVITAMEQKPSSPPPSPDVQMHGSEDVEKQEQQPATTIQTDQQPEESMDIKVDANHPQVISIVEPAMKAAEAEPYALSVDIIVDILEAAIYTLENERHQKHPDGPKRGGWILRNFPKTYAQWTECLERNLLPDIMILLVDESPGGIFLTNRFYNQNRQDINDKRKIRLKLEAEEARRRDEELRKAKEEEARLLQAATDSVSELETIGEQPATETTEPGSPPTEGSEVAGTVTSRTTEQSEAEKGDDHLTPQTEEGTEGESEQPSEGHEFSPEQPKPIISSTGVIEVDQVDGTEETPKGTSEEQDSKAADWQLDTDIDPEKKDEKKKSITDQDHVQVTEDTPLESMVIEDLQTTEMLQCPELAPYLAKRAQYEKDAQKVMDSAMEFESVQYLRIKVMDKTVDDIFQEAFNEMEKPFEIQGWEYSLFDIDEEEEDKEKELVAMIEEEEVEEEEVEDEDAYSHKKQLGDCSYFCPVALKESRVLYPGTEDWAARYRERLYYCSTAEARENFLSNPTKYLPMDKPPTPPPIRLIILGTRGSGKTLYGKHLAEKLGIFHINFKECLQEMIIGKTKKKIVPAIDEYELEEEIEEEESEDEEEKKEDEDVETKVTDASSDTDTGSAKLVSTEKVKEEEEVELTEDEESIKQAIISFEPLSEEILETVVPKFWHKEPFCSTGFVLEGFPRTALEVKYLAEQGLFPDAVIVLNLTDTEMVGRLLPPRMAKWRRKHKIQMAKKLKKKNKNKIKREKAMKKRREELIKERELARAERAKEKAAEKAEESDNDFEEDEDVEEEELEDSIEEILAEEFEDMEEEVEEEEEEESVVVEKTTEELVTAYNEFEEQLDPLLDALTENHFHKVEIDAGRKPHIVRYLLKKHLKPFVDFRRALFERAIPISEKLANRMLAFGYKQYSRFGCWCPVKLLEGDCLHPYYGGDAKPFPCLYRQYVYFLHSATAREAFLQDPLAYLRQPNPKPVIPIRLSIIGPPKSGKSSLAWRFVEEYGVMRLSIGEAMRNVLDTQPSSDLAQRMNNLLVQGLVVPEEMQMEALEVSLLDVQCQFSGYVLDGYPMTVRQVQLMEEKKIVPSLVIHLDLDDEEILNRGTMMRTSPTRTLQLHDSEPILLTKIKAYRSHATQVLEMYSAQHQNVVQVDPTYNKWWVWNRVLEATRANIVQRQTYITRIQQGKAASVAELGVTPQDFKKNLGEFDQFCPVSLSTAQFVDGSTVNSMKHVAEFKGRYYKMAGEKELQEFLARCENYLPPKAHFRLPEKHLLPRRRFKEEMQLEVKPVELQGYCPVTFLDGKLRYEALEEGDPDLTVEYLGKFYYMASEEKVWKFMRTPAPYSNLKLPLKLPPRKDFVPVTGLPMLGYMEQEVTTAIIAALTATGTFKPKYPFQSVTRSALFHTAYHLKAFNHKSSSFLRKKYKQKLQNFQDSCNVIQYLGDNMPIRYSTAESLTPEFHQKLELFFSLKTSEPTATWIV